MTTVNAVNTYITASTANEVAMPSQPCFGAWLDAQVDNVTGDGTVYTIAYDTEEFDQNNDFNGTTTFTAPVTGIYIFNVNVAMKYEAAVPTDCELRVVTSNLTYQYVDSDVAVEAQNISGHRVSVVADMDAADTMTTNVEYGGSVKVMDMRPDFSTQPRNWMSGALLV